MRKRKWLGTGIIEEFDARQQRLLDRILAEVRRYYQDLHETRYQHRYPLNLSRLSKLCHCSGSSTLNAIRVLAHSVDVQKGGNPPLLYERASNERNPPRRAYRIFLSKKT